MVENLKILYDINQLLHVQLNSAHRIPTVMLHIMNKVQFTNLQSLFSIIYLKGVRLQQGPYITDTNYDSIETGSYFTSNQMAIVFTLSNY